MGIPAADIVSLFPGLAPKSGFKQPRQKRKRVPEWWPLSDGSILLSIDGASTKCGWAVMEKTKGDPRLIDSGVIKASGNDKTPKADDLVRQVYGLANRVFRMNGIDYKPTDAAIEISFGVSRGDPQGMSVYNMAVGGCAAACVLAGLGVNRIVTYEWKKGLMEGAKKREAQKRRAIQLARQWFGIQPIDDNHAEALVIGAWLCWK